MCWPTRGRDDRLVDLRRRGAHSQREVPRRRRASAVDELQRKGRGADRGRRPQQSCRGRVRLQGDPRRQGAGDDRPGVARAGGLLPWDFPCSPCLLPTRLLSVEREKSQQARLLSGLREDQHLAESRLLGRTTTLGWCSVFTSLRPVHVRQSPESALIQAAYADRRARRSVTPYRLQIDQGLAILEALHETGWESPAQAWPAVPCNCCRP